MVNKTDTLLACIEELAGRYVLGMDPFDVERLAWQVHLGEDGRGREGTPAAARAPQAPPPVLRPPLPRPHRPGHRGAGVEAARRALPRPGARLCQRLVP